MEHFSHDADIGIRGYGNTIAVAFSQAAIAMTAVICDVNAVKPLIPVQVQCEAPGYMNRDSGRGQDPLTGLTRKNIEPLKKEIADYLVHVTPANWRHI